MIGKINLAFLFSMMFIFKLSAQSIDLSSLNSDIETGTDAGTGLTIEPLEGVANKCEDYVLDIGKEVGENTKSNGTKYYIGIGESAILAPTGQKNYITSRQNAYEQAMLFAKSARSGGYRWRVGDGNQYSAGCPRLVLDKATRSSTTDTSLLKKVGVQSQCKPWSGKPCFL